MLNIDQTSSGVTPMSRGHRTWHRDKLAVVAIILVLILVFLGVHQRAAASAEPMLAQESLQAASQLALTATPGANQVTLASVRNEVQYVRANTTNVIPATTPLVLNKGDSISVNNSGEALVSFSDVLRVRIFRDANMNLDLRGIVNPRLSAAKAIVRGGALYGSLNKEAKRRFQVSTDWAVIDIIGTIFWVFYEPASQNTWVVVKEGVVRVTSKATGRVVTVPGGFQTWVRRGASPEPPVPATRLLVGALFPSADVLTNGALSDGFLLDNAQCAVNASGSNVYAAPNAQTAPLGTVTQGQRFEANGRTRNSGWIRGINAAGQEGWLQATALTCAYDVVLLPVPLQVNMPVSTAAPAGLETFATFTVDRERVRPNYCTKLRWETKNAVKVSIYGDQDEPLNGWREVCPSTTTYYELRVQFSDGTVKIYKATVLVDPYTAP